MTDEQKNETDAFFSDGVETMPVDRTDQEYRLHPGFNQSTAVELLNKSPRHAFEKRRYQEKLAKTPEPDPDHSRDREMGTVIHKLMLGSTVGYYEINLKDYRTKDAQTKRSDCERAGVTPILSPDLERCRRSANAATEQLREVFGIELDGRSEVPLYWEEKIGQFGMLPCKAKLDHIRKDGLTILDLKTGEDANPKKLVRRILDSGCHVQAAAYSRALAANFSGVAGRTTFIDIFIETSGLVMCTPLAIVGSLYELGERGWLRACKRWWSSVEAAQYDGYTTQVMAPDAPPWALADEMGSES